jgi:RNA polymerase-interacting CarD/CdnL/TRCF family regulator
MESYAKGDRVVCPPHGAGVVSAVNRQRGTTFVTIDLDHSELRLILPAEAVSARGVRPVIKSAKAKAIVKLLKRSGEELPGDHTQRAKIVQDKERTGDAEALAEVIRDLSARQLDGANLSAVETRVLDQARRQLASELGLAMEIEAGEAMGLIDAAVGIDS